MKRKFVNVFLPTTPNPTSGFLLIVPEKDLIKLNSLGHQIGLHSHNHPTLLESLSYEVQINEYSTSLNVLSKILNKPFNAIKTASHPNGSYNDASLKILKELGIELAFKDSMKIEKEKGMKKINNSFLEIARQDHADIYKRMN